MADSLSQSPQMHTRSTRQANSATRRPLRSYLPTRARRLRTKTGIYVGQFERSFCAGIDPATLVEQIDALLHTGQTIKDGDTCHVSRLVWNYRDVVVKRYNHKGIVHSLRHTIKKSRAHRAWLNAQLLQELKVATPRPVAYIEHRKGPLLWQSYLVTEYIEGRMLHNFIRDDKIGKQRRLDAITQVVDLLNRLWKHRITHGDLKHTNVLITERGPILTDLDGMTVHRWKLPYQNRQKKDLERFLKKTDVSPDLHDHCRALLSNAGHSPQEALDDFDKMRCDGWAVRIRKGIGKDDIGDMLSLTDSSEGQFSKVTSSDHARVFRGRVSFDGTDHVLYLKRYLCRSALDFVKHLFRPSRARRALNASLMLQNCGFDAPVVAGLFERRIGPFCTDNSLLTEEVENARSMVEILTDLCRGPNADTLVAKRDLIRAFAETVGRMHAEGIFHGDLRLGNVLVVRQEQKWRFFFIDNERTRQFHAIGTRARLKNLVQVNMYIHDISNTDRVRFFRAYLSVNPSIQMRYGRWAAKIIAATNKRLSRKD
ncbi:MAG: lipopolysaccharide kinase InaA family protein, partial [Planctomycetota bacterium]